MGVITGRILGAASGLVPVAVPATVVANVVALRALTGSVAVPAALLRQYSAMTGQGGGEFLWDDTAATDDGGTRFNAGGLGSSAAGWRRVYEGDLHAAWFGAVGDGTTDDSAAIQAAHDSLPATGGTIVAQGGEFACGGLVFTKRVRLVLGAGGLKANAATCVTTTRNIQIEGIGTGATVLTGTAGGTMLRLAAPWGDAAGASAVEIAHCKFSGGARHVDASTLTGFGDGLLRLAHAVFELSTGTAVDLADSVFFSQVDHCLFLYNYRAFQAGQNTETVFTDCVFEQAQSGIESVKLLGSHHVRMMRCGFWGFAGQSNPDLLIAPINDGAGGYTYLEQCRFGSERELSLNLARRRIRVLGATAHHPTSRLVLRDCEFLRPGGFVVSSIGRTSNVATATIATGWDSIGHQVEVGDVVRVIASTDTSFAGAHTVTAKTLTTVSWASVGGDVAQAADTSLVTSLATCVVDLDNPVSGLLVDGCLFENYGACIDDTTTLESQNARGTTGKRVWGATNRVVGALGLECKETASGYWRGFDRAFPDATSPLPQLVATTRETPGLRNRIELSESLTGWGVAGGTMTGGQTDPLGGATAFKWTRDGNNQIVTDSGTGWANNESAVRGVDASGLGGHCWFQVWAKADTASTLWLMLIDSNGRTQWHRTVTLSATWKQYKLPVSISATYAGTLAFLISCGSVNAEAGSVYLWHPAIDDHGGDYLPTPTAASATSTAGARFERAVSIQGSAVRAGAGSPEAAVVGSVGDTYHDTTAGVHYVKASGAATTTGWQPVGVGRTAPGSMTLADGQWHIQYQRLQLTSTQRLTLAGTARYILTDL